MRPTAVKSASSIAIGGLLVALASLISACGMGGSDSGRIDPEWHRRTMIDSLLAHWIEVAPTDSGFMRTAIARNWKPAAEQTGYLTEHARLVFSLINGYEVTRDKRYLDAASRGADFLLKHYRDAVHGGFFNRVASDGKVISGI